MRLFRLFKNELVKEALQWVDDGIITDQQARDICLRYGADTHSHEQRSLGYNILIVLGFLFIGLSLITLLSANWDDIPAGVRTAGLIALTLGTQGWAWYQWQSGFRQKAVGFFFLGNLFYGTTIILIAQIYHLGQYIPDEIWLWAAGCLPFALLLNSRLLMVQTMALALIWFFMEAGEGYFPAWFPLFLIATGWLLWHGERSLLLFLATLIGTALYLDFALAELWRGNIRRFDGEVEHLAVTLFYFLAAFSFGKWLQTLNDHRALDYAAVVQIWSLRFVLIFLLVMSFEEPWRELIRADWQHTVSTMVVVALLSAVALAFARVSGDVLRTGLLLSAAAMALLLTAVLTNKDYATGFQVATNIVLVAAGIRLILQGISRGISHYFFLGIATVLLTALMRYFDLIGDYIGAAALFFVFALLMIGSAVYWKRSQRVEVKP